VVDLTAKPDVGVAGARHVATRKNAVVAGVSSSYVEAGPPTGATVVFVHGNPGSADTWHDLIESVAAFARCIAPDMPGYGPVGPAADFEYTIEGYERHLAALLDTLGVSSAHIVGHDLGGVWGLAWAAAHPRQLASLTLMSIGALPGYRWHRYARLYRIPVIGELLLRGATKQAVARVLRSGSTHDPPDWFVEDVVRQYRDRGTQRAVLAFYRGIPDLGSRSAAAASALRDRNPPTLVIWGAGDPYVPVRFAEMQKTYFPRAETFVLPGSGHWPLVDDPEAITGAVVTFLREQLQMPAERPVSRT
jgi:pimeloyl-ACP methyl ester carboxylesterase